MQLFIKDSPAVEVTDEESDPSLVLSYRPGVLREPVIGSVSKSSHNMLAEYCRDRYRFEPETKTWSDKLPRELLAERDLLLDTDDNQLYKAHAIMAASVEDLEPAQVLEWLFDRSEFFEQCYQKAIELNPALTPETEPEAESVSANAGEEQAPSTSSEAAPSSDNQENTETEAAVTG